MPLFSVVISFNNKKRAFAETLFYYPCFFAKSTSGRVSESALGPLMVLGLVLVTRDLVVLVWSMWSLGCPWMWCMMFSLAVPYRVTEKS